MVKFVFYPSKLKKQPLFANNFKIQGEAKAPCPPLPTTMHMALESTQIIFLAILRFSLDRTNWKM